MRVAVLRGGRSSEHEISLRSGESVAAGLREAGHEVLDVVIGRDGRWVCGGVGVAARPGEGLLDCEVAFPVLHGPHGEDGTVQGALEVFDVAYVGPGVAAAAVTIDKLLFKRLLAEAGLPQVGFCQAGAPGWRDRAVALGMPLWVKPARLGSSVGIRRVEEPAELDEAVAAARLHDNRVIVEAHCDGREVECSLLGNPGIGEDRVEVSEPGELVYQAEWYDFEAKYTAGGMELRVPAPIGDEIAAQVRSLAERVYRDCGCTGLARCDFFVTAGGEAIVNELNTIPGFTETSVFGKLFAASGIPYPELCDRLVRLAVERHAFERSLAL